MIDPLTPAELVSAIKSSGKELNDWEKRFLTDIDGKIRAGYNLSERQIDKLRAIHDG